MGEISAGQLQSLVAGRHFPLCMTVMYERLAAEHHLKHWGLQQFTLFLKSVGLPLEQALMFFRQQFSPRWVDGGLAAGSTAAKMPWLHNTGMQLAISALLPNAPKSCSGGPRAAASSSPHCSC